jgi:hypothetical protein
LFLCASYITKTFLQNWGDFADISQAVTVYVAFGSHVLLLCWFGTQLTQRARENGLLLLLLTWFEKIVLNVDVAPNQLSNYTTISALSSLLY